MKVLVVENYDNTPLGLVGQALDEGGAALEVVRAHHGEVLPAGPSGHDALIILGGGQSAVADEEYPYLPHLVSLTRAFGDSGRPVLGICLGSQIIARAYGGANILGRPVEFGYHPVAPRAEASADPVLSALGEAPTPMFHWHHDTVTLPEGAVHLASSAATPYQAFRMGRRVYAVQFHFEASREVVANWSGSFAEIIRGSSPDWADRREAELAEHGPPADAAGLALARAWMKMAGEK